MTRVRVREMAMVSIRAMARDRAETVALGRGSRLGHGSGLGQDMARGRNRTVARVGPEQ